MRIVVFSDSHGKTANMEKIIKRCRDADLFLHLGDGAEDFLELTSRLAVIGRAVKGNCDVFFLGKSPVPTEDVLVLDGIRIFMTHGNRYLSYGVTDNLIYAARERDADVVLFGHTHIAEVKYIPESETGKALYIMNPGSCEKPRDDFPSFGSIDIVNGSVFVSTSHIE